MGFPPSANYGFCANCGTPRSTPAAQFCPNLRDELGSPSGSAAADLLTAASPVYAPPPAPPHTRPLTISRRRPMGRPMARFRRLIPPFLVRAASA